MKPFWIIVFVMLCAMLVPVSQAHAGLWDSLATSGMPTDDVDHKYKLDVHGYNVRVYEWTPKENPNVSCVFLAGNENSSGVACYEKKSKK